MMSPARGSVAPVRSFEVVPPRAEAMIESMRAFGYSTPAAIADLVDNSISAGASYVTVTFEWEGAESRVTVADDGQGMRAEELSGAMRLGSQSPREERAPEDLGRFGLGLKTASFSQGRSLTVASRRTGEDLAIRRWDLDEVEAMREWCLLLDCTAAAEAVVHELGTRPAGTVVIWEKLDRLVGASEADDTAAHDRFLAMVEQVEQHLAMIFHRFLSGPAAVTMSINGNAIEPWDPFLEGERSTQRLADEILMCGDERIGLTPFVLPHHSRISHAVHAGAAGPAGWNAHQGFYVYRSRRLLVPGDWLRLGFQKVEHYKLARIRLDLPNSVDAAWQIEVRKATARPPGGLRSDLKRIAEVTRRRAAEIYRHRGKALARSATTGPTFLWKQSVRRGKLRYRVEREHPAIAEALRSNADFEHVLRLVEETVPVPLITLNAAEHPDELAAPFEGADEREIQNAIRRVFEVLIEHGMTPERAKEQLISIEPFDAFPHLIETVEDEP